MLSDLSLLFYTVMYVGTHIIMLAFVEIQKCTFNTLIVYNFVFTINIVNVITL